MAIATPEEGTLHLDDLPAEEQRSAEAAPELLARLRAAWGVYRAENESGWAAIVNAQAKDPSLA